MSRGRIDVPEAGNAPDRRDLDRTTSMVTLGDHEPERVWTDDDFTVADDLAADDLTADDLTAGIPTRPVVGPAIRRRWRRWCAAGLLGLLLGAGYFTIKPPPYQARTLVLITQQPGQAAADQMLTEAVLAQSRTVAEAAMTRLGIPQNVKSVQKFLTDYSVISPTDRILQITVKAPSSAQAVSWARAIAAEFIQIRNSELQAEQGLTFAALEQQVKQDTQQVASLSAQINALSSKSAADKALLDSLRAQKNTATATVAGLRQAVAGYEASSEVSTASAVKGSQVLDAAQALPRSHLKYPVLYLGGGLAGGLAIGLGLVVVIALTSTRLRRRDDVARALGGPVQFSIGRFRAGWLPWGPGLAGTRDPAIRKVAGYLRRLVPEEAGTVSLAVVAADDIVPAALSVVSLALTLASEGKKVMVADLSPRAVLGRLFDITKPGIHSTDAAGEQLVLAISEPDDNTPFGPVRHASSASHARLAGHALDRAYMTADVLITLITLDPALGSEHVASWASESVVILTAGRSSATRIQTVGEMIRVAGTPLRSAVLLGADKKDVSLGLSSAPSHEGMLAAVSDDASGPGFAGPRRELPQGG